MSEPRVPDIAYEINEAREAVTLTIGTERMTLDTVQLAELLKLLGAMRAAMVPAVTADLPQGTFLQVDTPRMAVHPTPDMRHAAVIARTPQYGWISFLLDRTQADALGRHLADLSTRLHATN